MNSHHAVETLEEPHQSLNTVIGKLPAFQPRDFWLLDRVDGTVGVRIIVVDNLKYAGFNTLHRLGRRWRLTGLHQEERLAC